MQILKGFKSRVLKLRILQGLEAGFEELRILKGIVVCDKQLAVGWEREEAYPFGGAKQGDNEVVT
jgi:hypothetical protein